MIELHNLLGRLVALDPAPVDLLDRICAGPLIDDAAMAAPPHVEGEKRGRIKITTPPTLI